MVFRKSITIIILVVSVLLLNSCGATKKVVKEKETIESIKSTPPTITAKKNKIKTLTITNSKITYYGKDSKSTSFTGKIYISPKKGMYFSASLIGLMFAEAYATDTNFCVLSRLNRTCYKGDKTIMDRYSKGVFTPTSLANAFINFINSNKSNSKQSTSINRGNIQINLSVNSWYEDYVLIPKQLTVEMLENQKLQHKVEINVADYTFNEEMNIQFSIPEQYKVKQL